MHVRIVLLSLGLLVGASAACGGTGGDDQVVLDLIDALPQAKQEPSPEVFSVVNATINGDTRPAILVREPSRLTWTVDVPADAWLTFAFGLEESAWTVEGDGVLFQVGVAADDEYTELFSLVANPFANPSDRMWHDLMIDLSAYAGEQVRLHFNTRQGPPDPPSDDRRGDAALWARPRLVR